MIGQSCFSHMVKYLHVKIIAGYVVEEKKAAWFLWGVDVIHKWLPIHYSFVFVQISLSGPRCPVLN